MVINIPSFYRYCCFLLCLNVFSQTEVYKSNILFTDFQSASAVRPMGSGQEVIGSILISANKILFNASNYKMYTIDKDSLKPIWETNIGWRSNSAPYLYKGTFLSRNYQGEMSKVAQYDLNTGAKIRELPFESINSKPYFENQIMYGTAVADGGKLLAYDLEQNKVIWQKNIGHGVDFQPVYLKNNIIANAEDDNWFAIDYNGNLLEAKSKKRTYLDSTVFAVKKYKFLTHDGKEVTQDFLKKYKIASDEYQVKTNETHTFILAENQFLILGNDKKKVVLLDMATAFSIENGTYESYNAILRTAAESVWLCYQNYLLHYDFVNKKLLRKLDLNRWSPHQLLIENKRIWMISKNDGQLYGLDFEPDKKTADFITAKAEMERDRNNPRPPDKKKIEAAKAAQENFKIRNRNNN